VSVLNRIICFSGNLLFGGAEDLFIHLGIVKTCCGNCFFLRGNLLKNGSPLSSEQGESYELLINFKSAAVIESVMVGPDPPCTLAGDCTEVVSWLCIFYERHCSLLVQGLEVWCGHVIVFDSFGALSGVGSELDILSCTD
jgi:hypothetical protein